MKTLFLSTLVFVGSVFLFFPQHPTQLKEATENLIRKTREAEAKLEFGPLTTQEVVDLANAFKATLTSSQISTTQLAYTLTNAKQWSNFPASFAGAQRLGVRFGDLSSTQLAAAKALIKGAAGSVGVEGYQEIVEIWAADDYLNANGGGSAYGAGNYYIAFLGTPSMSGTWELQSGGHHLAFANTYKDGALVGATPSFRAVEPFTAFASGSNTYQPIVQERDSFAAMFSALSSTQLTSAKASSNFSDIVLGPGKDWQFPTTKIGLQCSGLSTTQKQKVLAAIRTYVSDIDTANANLIMAKYTSEIDQTYIAYAGNSSLTVQGDYVRIDGPSVWIEYYFAGGVIIRTTPHPHSVWRDRTSDYGGTGNTTPTKEVSGILSSVSHYPNPTASAITLDINLDHDADVKIELYDMNGRFLSKMYQGNLASGETKVSLNLSAYPKGSYIYTVQANEDGAIRTVAKKVIKM